MTAPRPTREQVDAVPTELYWSPSVHAEHGWGLVWSTVDGRFVTPSKLRADAVRLVPEQPAVPDGRRYDQLTEQEGGPPNERLPLYAPAGAEGPKCACEIPTAELSPPCPRHGPIQWPTVPDGEDVPARLDAAADALFSVCDDGALIFSFRDLAERLRDSDGGTPEVRAAVAAALVQPTGAGS